MLAQFRYLQQRIAHLLRDVLHDDPELASRLVGPSLSDAHVMAQLVSSLVRSGMLLSRLPSEASLLAGQLSEAAQQLQQLRAANPGAAHLWGGGGGGGTTHARSQPGANNKLPEPDLSGLFRRLASHLASYSRISAQQLPQGVMRDLPPQWWADERFVLERAQHAGRVAHRLAIPPDTLALLKAALNRLNQVCVSLGAPAALEGVTLGSDLDTLTLTTAAAPSNCGSGGSISADLGVHGMERSSVFGRQEADKRQQLLGVLAALKAVQRDGGKLVRRSVLLSALQQNAQRLEREPEALTQALPILAANQGHGLDAIIRAARGQHSQRRDAHGGAGGIDDSDTESDSDAEEMESGLLAVGLPEGEGEGEGDGDVQRKGSAGRRPPSAAPTRKRPRSGYQDRQARGGPWPQPAAARVAVGGGAGPTSGFGAAAAVPSFGAVKGSGQQHQSRKEGKDVRG
jgi:hypothetical protein